MFYKQNNTFWYQFSNFKHFLKAENSEGSLASSCAAHLRPNTERQLYAHALYVATFPAKFDSAEDWNFRGSMMVDEKGSSV